MRLPKALFSLSSVLVSILAVSVPQAYAEIRVQTNGNANVNINSTQNFSSTSKNSSTTTNRIQINGQEVLNETDQSNTSNSHNSRVDVKLENGQGTVKYKVNGEEKTIQVTPKDGDTDVTIDGSEMEVVNDTDKKAEERKEAVKKKVAEEKKETKSFMESITESIKNFFASLFS